MTMRIVRFAREAAQPITLFDSTGAFSALLSYGSGECHVYCIHIDPGGSIGQHPAGFGQLFLVVEGAGWAAGADGVRAPLQVGEGAYFERGEFHSKGSDQGMTAIMIQVADLVPR
jgi:hypothetical protein